MLKQVTARLSQRSVDALALAKAESLGGILDSGIAGKRGMTEDCQCQKRNPGTGAGAKVWV